MIQAETWLEILQDKNTWWLHFLIVAAICATGLIYLGTADLFGSSAAGGFQVIHRGT